MRKLMRANTTVDTVWSLRSGQNGSNIHHGNMPTQYSSPTSEYARTVERASRQPTTARDTGRRKTRLGNTAPRRITVRLTADIIASRMLCECVVRVEEWNGRSGSWLDAV